MKKIIAIVLVSCVLASCVSIYQPLHADQQ
ncbi:hypothetical protein FT4114_08215 [Francisella tularensis subsp. tularensis WY-00W4114]|nr:putative membrane protein [Francisella tularensis subsp. tularensis]AKH92539.1 hypothetical protein FT4114_08215 [Francisella tularensis subsp. tularensis WY-00W4114]EKM85278.1 hypothetical protein B344_08438 [Francisella tularensis subsp. tularensis 831]EKM85538.1 hypothetical protein B345_08501 [Francisella tularensis subsp. tularensis AS_713]EKM90240.1 hypothetical protein B341_08481 [Francisella tularensis subsp. tularensis 70102010]EKM91388.1 hypothetical protein B342_08544 [Francisell